MGFAMHLLLFNICFSVQLCLTITCWRLIWMVCYLCDNVALTWEELNKSGACTTSRGIHGGRTIESLLLRCRPYCICQQTDIVRTSRRRRQNRQFSLQPPTSSIHHHHHHHHHHVNHFLYTLWVCMSIRLPIFSSSVGIELLFDTEKVTLPFCTASAKNTDLLKF